MKCGSSGVKYGGKLPDSAFSEDQRYSNAKGNAHHGRLDEIYSAPNSLGGWFAASGNINNTCDSVINIKM